MPTQIHDTLIVGAGFTGIGTAIKLAKAGVEDFVILEREDRVGGTFVLVREEPELVAGLLACG